MMTNYFLKLLCRSSSRRTEQQYLQQYNFNKIIQQKTCASPKLKSHWNKKNKVFVLPFVFCCCFFSFSDHIFWFFFSLVFFFFFFLIFSTVTRSACIFFQSLICSFIFIFFQFFFLILGQLLIMSFALPSTSVLTTSNFISPSLVISVIN